MSDDQKSNDDFELSNDDLLAALVRRRAIVKSSLTRVATFMERFGQSSDSSAEAASRLNTLPSILSQFDDVQQKIEEIHINNDVEHNQQRDEFESKYHDIAGRLSRLTVKSPHITTSDANTQNNLAQNPWSKLEFLLTKNLSAKSVTHLPSLPLEKFDGDYLKWPRFYNCFMKRVNDVVGLDEVEKLYFLRSCLQGAPLDLIDVLDVDTSSYKNALSLLKDRYERKRFLIDTHVRSLLDMKNLASPASKDLRNFLSTFDKHVEALRSLKRPVEHWDDLLVGIIRNKLDLATLEKWDLAHKVNEDVTLKMLYDFLETRASSLESFEGQLNHSRHTPKSRVNTRSLTLLAAQKRNNTCVICSQTHMIYHCPKFKNMSITNRYSEVKQRHLCFNCLLSGHGSRDCKSQLCRHCGKKHNSMLHGLPYQSKNTSSMPIGTSNEITTTVSKILPEQPQPSSSSSTALMTGLRSTTIVNNACVATQVLLSTAIIMVQNHRGQRIPCRTILDNGSQINVLTRRMARRLNLEITSASLPICGINGVNTQSSQWTKLSFYSVHSPYSKTIGCHILPAVTIPLPPQSFEISEWNLPDHVQSTLADPGFNVTSDVDLLIGAETYYELIRTQPLVMPGGLPWLYDTVLGWVISGPLPNDHYQRIPVSTMACTLSTSAWMCPSPARRTKHEEELACERHFQETHRRQVDGRFIVELPFRMDPNCLGRSMEQALSRFLSMERKLQRDPDLSKEYKEFMKEYIDLGHMSLLDDPVILPGQYFYIPHHAVFKATSSTTKLRVVFDASMKSSSNVSLNDALMTGSILQQDLFDILLRFRLHIVVVTADVAKMYRQVLINERDRHFQRILWRDSPNKSLQHYVLNTVTYGTGPASFLATRVLMELANQCASSCPTTSNAIKNDFYVDDFISGADSVEEAKVLCENVSKILEGGGMFLRKWCSNAEELRHFFSCASTENHYSLELNSDMTVSSLGLTWCPIADELRFLNKERIKREAKTKRDLLSTLNSIFDPLGFLGPVLIRGKIFLQELWQLHLDWDDLLPYNLQTKWINFVVELEGLCKISIPRAVRIDPMGKTELHGFCDASQSAYGACIYLRQQTSSNTWSVRLLCAKSRVAPTKTLTIPRLELCGALILAELLSRVAKSIGVSVNNFFCWCDSTVVISWIQGTPAQWKTFVANRVSQIIDTVGVECWHHVPTEHNPADLLSRGVTTEALSNMKIWWIGPQFLSASESNWPNYPERLPFLEEISLEKKPIKFTLTAAIPANNILLERYSNWNKLLRVTVVWVRFLTWLRGRNRPELQELINGPLTVSEMDKATNRWVKFAQQQCFEVEIQELNKGNLITKGPLKHLSPYMDNDLMRVGGRLEHSNESFTHKHPAVLPRNHRVTQLIAEAYHIRFLHIGPQGLLANIRLQFWPLRGRDLARGIVNKCIKCFKARPIPLQPPMGQLPAARVSTNRPFTQTGVDFAGPLSIKVGLRKGTLIKAYVSVFICLSTKAIHLEPVSSLTSDAFMACLRRFISRRGLPTHIWSDNGTNFVGAKRELQNYFIKQRNGHTVTEDLVSEGIQWIFIPPAAPHFGGLWEASVKAFKHHFRRTVADVNLNFEELCTLLTQIESCLNSRPLMALSSDPADYQVLTPNHFLLGGPSQIIPIVDLTDIPSNRLRKWALIQKLYQGIWKRWRNEYLSSLQAKAKWFKTSASIKVDSLAVLMDDNSPPMCWKMVRIQALHPGQDGITRVVTVRTSSGTVMKRPLVKLCPLPED